MKTHFYDIESLDNVFTLCNYKPDTNSVDIFYLVDDGHLTSAPDFAQALLDRIYERNKNFDGTITLYDLRYEEANEHLAKTFGLSDAYMMNNAKLNSTYPDEFRLVCDTDYNYDEDTHPYLLGYNSYNYDTTMLAFYEHEAYTITTVPQENGTDTIKTVFTPVKASLMREYNNDLFTKRFINCMPQRLAQTYHIATKTWSQNDYQSTPWRIRKNMLLSGRHLDVARLNEKQQKIGLKRLLGMLGYQILESDKLAQGASHIDNADQLYDLIAYNISDCINLEKLFLHKTYQSQFALKKGLLQTYPELIYEKLPNEYKPDKKPERVRRDRLTIDSSSAQFATKSLCPYGHLTDIPVVSFMYPSERIAKELGIKRVNVLEESKKFFYKNFKQPELRAKFDTIYNYYKSIEGKNFNDSETYREDYGDTNEVYNLSKLPKIDSCMCYYNADGSASSCFVTFSTGGIHGAEYNKNLYEYDLAEYEKSLEDLEWVKSQYPNPIDLKAAKNVMMMDGSIEPATKFLKSGSTLKHAEYKDLTKNKPVLFKVDDDGATKLNTNYVYTSADPTNHEDFTSYYPNMLRMLSAFWNEGLGYDRYAEIFDNKQKYGKLMKDKTIPKDKREFYSVLREGTKLILNSASGAADANFESNIRMNNIIISMRIIGQLFTWRIGQAQTIKGARVTSTNTDGLFTVLEETLNNLILEEESADIGVEIEPESTYLISKDSNNRLEMDADTGVIERASGGTLGCHEGPDPTKSLAHSAILDWALCEYLIVSSLNTKPEIGIDKPFDNTTGMNILKASKSKFERIKWLTMMQNIIASSPGSISYIFGTTDENAGKPIIMQHYNRVFIMKDKTPNTMHLYAAVGKQITPATKQKRQRDGERAQQHDALAIQVLASNNVSISSLGTEREASIKKVTGIETEWYIYVLNKDLNYLSDEEFKFIEDNLDYDKYLEILKKSFEKNWMNDTIEARIAKKTKKKKPLTMNETANRLLDNNVKTTLELNLYNDSVPNNTQAINIGTTVVKNPDKIREITKLLDN